MFKKAQNLISVAIEWLIYLSVFLVPLVFIPQVASVFTTPKLYAFRVITLMIVLLWGIGLLIGRKVKFRWTPVFCFFVLYGIISIVTTFNSINIWTSLFGVYGRFVGVFTVLNLLFWTFIVFNEINTRRKILNVLKVSIVTAVLIAAYGLLQYFDLFVNIFYWTQDPLERAFGTIGHSNHTAAYLGINLVILVGLIRISSFGWNKVLYWVSLILLSIALVLTGSRGGVFAVLIALGLWGIYGLKVVGFKKYLKKYWKIGGSIFTVLIIGSVAFWGQIKTLPVVERSVSTVTYIQEGNMPDRMSWWMSTFEMIKDKPVLGHGLSTYRDAYNGYRRLDYRTPDDTQDTITPQSAHNEYLTIAAGQGVLGLGVYLLMIVMVFLCMRDFMKRANDSEDKILIYSIAMGIVVYLAQVVMSFGVVSTLFVLYTLLGLMISMAHIEEKEKEVKVGFFVRSITAILIFVFVIAGCVFSFFSLAAEYHSQQAQSNIARRNMQEAIEHYDRAIWYMPYISEYYERYGDLLFKLGISMPEGTQTPYLRDAYDQYTNAVKYDDHLPHIYINVALVSSRLHIEKASGFNGNPYDGIAVSFLEQASGKAKNNPLYMYKYAEMQEYFEKYEDAYKSYQKTLEIRNPYKDAEQKLIELVQYSPLPVEEDGTSESSDGDSEQEPETT